MLHEAFLNALKKALKAKGITYKMLAEHLNISEASVKRVFSQGSLTLERISAILEWAELSFLDVSRMMDSNHDERQQELTLEQEEVLAKDNQLCAFFHHVLFGWSIKELRRSDLFDDASINRFKTMLQDLGLSVTAPRGEIQLRVGRGVKWRPQGPMVRAYGAALREEFLNGDFEGAGSLKNFGTRSLTPASQTAIRKKIKALMDEIDSMTTSDNIITGTETEPTAFLFAMRPFYFSFFVNK